MSRKRVRQPEMTPYGFTLDYALERIQGWSGLIRNPVWGEAARKTAYAAERHKEALARACVVPGCLRPHLASKLRKNMVSRERFCAEHKSKLEQLDERKAYAREKGLLVDRLTQIEIAEIRAAEPQNWYEYRPPSRRALTSVPAREASVYYLLGNGAEILYIGKAVDVRSRLYGASGHSRKKPWFSEVVAVRVMKYSTESHALRAEAWDITHKSPKYNIVRPLIRGEKPEPLLSYIEDVEHDLTIVSKEEILV